MVRTHTFNGTTYRIEFADRIDGVCDVPDDGAVPEILLTNGNELRNLNSDMHEAMHAIGIPDEYLHDEEGFSKTEDVSRFLWRLGYRKPIKKNKD